MSSLMNKCEPYTRSVNLPIIGKLWWETKSEKEDDQIIV